MHACKKFVIPILIFTTEHLGQGLGIAYIRQYPNLAAFSGDTFATKHLKQNWLVCNTPHVASGNVTQPSAFWKWKTLLPSLLALWFRWWALRKVISRLKGSSSVRSVMQWGSVIKIGFGSGSFACIQTHTIGDIGIILDGNTNGPCGTMPTSKFDTDPDGMIPGGTFTSTPYSSQVYSVPLLVTGIVSLLMNCTDSIGEFSDKQYFAPK